MRALLTGFLFASLVALSACGGKDKKKVTAPEPVAAGSADTSEGAVDTNQTETGGDADKSATLQQVVYFEFDQSDLDDAAKAKLTENAEWLKEDATRTLTIEGHTDEVGTTEYNAALGERRAQAARDYMARLGADQARIKIITYGEEKPASEQDALNRRSVFIATKK